MFRITAILRAVSVFVSDRMLKITAMIFCLKPVLTV